MSTARIRELWTVTKLASSYSIAGHRDQRAIAVSSSMIVWVAMKNLVMIHEKE